MTRPAAIAALDAGEAVRVRLWPAAFGRATPVLFLLPAVLLTGILAVGLVMALDSSLRPLDPMTYRQAAAWSLGNYEQLAGRPAYLWILGRSLLAAVLVTALCLVLALPYAYCMVRTASPALRKLLLVGLFLPFFIGQVVRAYGWLLVLGQEGLLNEALAGLGLARVSVLYTFPAVVMGLAQYMLPFAVLLLAPAVVAIDEDVEAASAGLGASWTRTFRHIVIPMARPGLIGAGIVVFTITLTDYAMPQILGGGTNDFIANAIYDAFFRLSNAGVGSALSVLLVLLGSTLVALLMAVAGAGTMALAAGEDR
ncbi:ABC transporter permease [Marinivivus vitaminiproducens]|uniref:ABC transporter permease n=1 Tax=Marinivivus vitaminiproducens TaxID=3035935 RepID=UPI002798E56F|nr:ABC transporter permease [Geminicoccaceae bacterium SCSIO 64248]